MTTQGSSVVITNNQNEILLVLREDVRLWALPAGHVEPGETFEQAAIREAREETGYEVELDRLVGEYWRPQYPHGGNTMQVFAGRVVGGDLSQHDWESLEVRWFPLDALPKKLFVLSREHIQDARANAPAPLKSDQRLPKAQAVAMAVFLVYRSIRNAVRAALGRGPR
jgi:8-oxo-dGTP pyrophosphatase MutT (NUDIX family)